MKKVDVEIKSVHFDEKSKGLPGYIFVVWKKVGYNGEYSKLFYKNQKVFDTVMSKNVYEKSKELYPEHFL